MPGEEQGRQLSRVEREVLEVGLGLAVVDAQLLVGPGKQAVQVGRIGHPVAVLNSLIALADEANRPQRHLADQGGGSGRPLLLGPPQGRGGQGQGGKRLAPRPALRLGLGRRAAIDRPRSLLGQSQSGQGQHPRAGCPRRCPVGDRGLFDELPPRQLTFISVLCRRHRVVLVLCAFARKSTKQAFFGKFPEAECIPPQRNITLAEPVW